MSALRISSVMAATAALIAVGAPAYAGLNLNALTSNGLTNNALTYNALTANSITSNSITLNAVTQNAVTQNALSAGGSAINDLNGVAVDAVNLPDGPVR